MHWIRKSVLTAAMALALSNPGVAAVSSWSTTAGSNSSVDGVSIAEGMAASGLNNALRGLMAEVATWINSSQTWKNTLAATTLTTWQTTEDSASGGPQLDLTRISASPAASDALAVIRWLGRDSGAAGQVYAAISATLVDPLAASEDARLLFQTTIAGTTAAAAYVQAGLVVGTPTGADPGAGKINATDLQSNGRSIVPLVGSVTFDPASTLTGNTAVTSLTVTGAAVGDFAICSFSNDLQNQFITAEVTTTSTVECIFRNETGATIDLLSGTLRAMVFKAS